MAGYRFQPQRRLVMRAAFAGAAAAAVAACTRGAQTGPVEIKWDRDVCAHCSMAISDRRFAAQLRGGPKGEVFKFDDVGCAIGFLERQPWGRDAATQVWVTAYGDGRWLDARTAKYQPGKTSPMGYNFAALAPDAGEGVSFDQLRVAVLEFDRKAQAGAHMPAMGAK